MKKLSLILLFFASAAQAEIYTWTDNRGTSHYVSSQYDIPQRYLPRAKIYDVASGKKLPLAAAPAPAPAPGTATQPAPASPVASPPLPQSQPQVQPAPAAPAAAPVIQQPAAPQRAQQPQGRTRGRQGLPPEDEP